MLLIPWNPQKFDVKKFHGISVWSEDMERLIPPTWLQVTDN